MTDDIEEDDNWLAELRAGWQIRWQELYGLCPICEEPLDISGKCANCDIDDDILIDEPLTYQPKTRTPIELTLVRKTIAGTCAHCGEPANHAADCERTDCPL